MTTLAPALRSMKLLCVAGSLVEDSMQMMIPWLELEVLLQPSCLLPRYLIVVDNADPDMPSRVKLPGVADSSGPDMPPQV